VIEHKEEIPNDIKVLKEIRAILLQAKKQTKQHSKNGCLSGDRYIWIDVALVQTLRITKMIDKKLN
jgi:hypothetical protein